jgi:hypothetical protein
MRLRAISTWLYGISLVSILLGSLFAFVLPRL